VVPQRAAPPAGEAALTYALLPHGLAIWERDTRGLRFHWQNEPEQSHLKLASQFVAHCASPSSPALALRSEGQELYAWLLGPVVADLAPGQTLVVEPDGPLGQVPFAALVSADGDYVAAHYAVEYAPLVGRDPGNVAPGAFSAHTPTLVVGSPVAAGLSALPDAREEAQAVQARFPLATRLDGAAATLAAVRRALPHAELIHFAGHAGHAGPGGGGALLLAPVHAGEWPVPLTSAALAGLDLRRCRLVVLSACATTPGDTGGLFEPRSLVRAFLLDGTRYVLANRWNVDSASSRRLMDSFYAHLQQGASVPQALQAAQQQQWHDAVGRRPYYWAAGAVLTRDLESKPKEG